MATLEIKYGSKCRDGSDANVLLPDWLLMVKKPWANCWAGGVGGPPGSPQASRQMQGDERESLPCFGERKAKQPCEISGGVATGGQLEMLSWN